MADAVVGDDVLGDDPTVKELESEFARVVGKEAGLFVPSGSMANLCAVLVHCRPGDEAVMEERTHTFRYEGGGASRFGGISIRTFVRPDGVPEVDDLLRNLRNPKDHHQPRTTLFILENSHNMAGGKVVRAARVAELAEAAHANGLRVHVDGARLFNACTSLGVEADELARPVDSVMCCLSKGLGAPVGSCLAGSAGFIDEARRARKALGGGMRQAGVIAAAGLIALREGRLRLHEDHARARRLALALAEMPGFVLDVEAVETNILMVDLDRLETSQVILALKEQGVLCLAPQTGRLRLIVHRDLDDADIDRAIRVLGETGRALLAGKRVEDRADPAAEPWNG
ncbi:MAG: GntG family PLP-dependent aldolase [Planctomycetota bacterium]